MYMTFENETSLLYLGWGRDQIPRRIYRGWLGSEFSTGMEGGEGWVFGSVCNRCLELVKEGELGGC